MEYFTFNGIRSKDLGMFIVNSDDGYTLSQLMPQPIHSYEIKNRRIIDKGSYHGERTISFKVIAETKKPIEYINSILRWLDTKELKPLIFSREPYKQYYVKRTGELNPVIYPSHIVINLQFIALDFLAYSTFKTTDIDEFLFFDEKYKSSGLVDGKQYVFKNPKINRSFSIYHGGNADYCYPIIKIKGSFSNLVIENKTTGEICTLSYELNNDEIIVDCARKIILFNGIYSVVGHNGDFISLKGRNSLFDDFVTELDNGENDIYIYSPNSYDIKEISFEFRYVYY